VRLAGSEVGGVALTMRSRSTARRPAAARPLRLSDGERRERLGDDALVLIGPDHPRRRALHSARSGRADRRPPLDRSRRDPTGCLPFQPKQSRRLPCTFACGQRETGLPAPGCGSVVGAVRPTRLGKRTVRAHAIKAQAGRADANGLRWQRLLLRSELRAADSGDPPVIERHRTEICPFGATERRPARRRGRTPPR
jgi:hypothetical protein